MKLQKQPTDTTTFGIDFTGQLSSSDTLITDTTLAIVSGDSVPIISGQTINTAVFGTVAIGKGVIFTCALGTSGYEYVLRTVCTTALGETITGEVVLLVLNALELSLDYYGNILRASQYFQSRLNSTAWTSADNPTQRQALFTASQLIDRLNFKGSKATSTQILEFPRQGQILVPGADPYSLDPTSNQVVYETVIDTLVPKAIELATYELALNLLDGKDPDAEVDSLIVTSNQYSSVRSTYDRSRIPAHVMAGIPSIVAWNYIRPYLRDGRSIILSRVS